jgi:predicted DNA-binding ribbon-helix-helix protein
MAHTRRAQILMEPEEYEQLARIAERRSVSVAELIRSAVRAVYLRSADERAAVVERIASMGLPTAPWPDLKREIEDAYDAGLP